MPSRSQNKHFTAKDITDEPEPPPKPSDFDGYWTELFRLARARRLRQVLARLDSKKIAELLATPRRPHATDTARMSIIEDEVHALIQLSGIDDTPDTMACACNLLFWDTIMDGGPYMQNLDKVLSPEKQRNMVQAFCSHGDGKFDVIGKLLESCGLSKEDRHAAGKFCQDLWMELDSALTDMDETFFL